MKIAHLIILLSISLAFGSFSCELMEDTDADLSTLLNQQTETLAEDPTAIHTCIDKQLEEDQLRSAVIRTKLWSIGQVIRVKFMDSLSNPLRLRIEKAAREWELYANVRFQFVRRGKAEIRIGLDARDGSWSYMGRDALYLDSLSSTMNFGWFSDRTPDYEIRRTTLHEFGHALGLIHEHQHPLQNIQWDLEKVYTYYAQTQGWKKEDVDQNLFRKYSSVQTQFCQYDPLSIMHYPVSKQLTLDGSEVRWNIQLSAEDKNFIARMYPFRGPRVLNCQ
jgi:serralysin